MTEPRRIRPEVAEPVVQDGRSREDARRAEREAALLDEHPAPLHDLDDDADDEEGATWVHLLCDHGYGPHSLDDANLAELRAHHADAHEADEVEAERDEDVAAQVEAIVDRAIDVLLPPVRARCYCHDYARPCPSCGRVEYGIEVGARHVAAGLLPADET